MWINGDIYLDIPVLYKLFGFMDYSVYEGVKIYIYVNSFFWGGAN